jgi:8-oxo-dGTP pyrophosphatase MutT (NUDIX family)
MSLYQGPVFGVDRVDGKDVVVHGPSVAIVALDGDEVVLVRQERVPAGGELLELPAGMVDEGETPLEAAQRELREETGLRGGTWEELPSFFTTPGFCDERMYLFLATGLEAGEAEEEIELVRLPVDEAIAQVEDAKTLVGLLFLKRR